MSKRPRILLVGNHFSGAGFNPNVCQALADRLRRHGWQVAATSHHAGRLTRLCDMLGTVWRSRHGYDVAQVDVYSGRAFLWAEAVCRLLRLIGKPHIVTLHGGDLARFAGRHPRRMAELLGGAAAITAPSRYLLDPFAPEVRPDDASTQLATLRGAPKPFGPAGLATGRSTGAQPVNRSTPVHLIPNPIEVDAFRYRQRLTVEPQLVWLRAFHRIYQPEVAVAVLGELVRDFPAARLTMAGPDKGDGSLARTRALAGRLGLARCIDFPGAVAKAALAALLDKADVFLNTARVDNTPVSVLEAMAAGLCIVSTNVGGMPYLLRHECDALMTAPGRPTEMAAAVRRVLREPGLAAQLSRNARRNVGPYDWSVVLPMWERLLVAAAQQGAAQAWSRRGRRQAVAQGISLAGGVPAARGVPVAQERSL
jgi:glycosyltransferase involved in cell wall biosynthesis